MNLFKLLIVGSPFILLGCLSSCMSKTEVVTVNNSSSFPRNGEMVEVNLTKIFNDDKSLINSGLKVVDDENKEIPSQITSDSLLIFQVSVPANDKVKYRIKLATPSKYDTCTLGSYHPDREDDIAWENDRGAFRLYGPALQRSGERAFGYDIWAKNVSRPVVAERYQLSLHPKKGKRSLSYHNDHGTGLDCYKVGPTLGAGTMALLRNDSIVYPRCYTSYKILDNGPLRFRFQLTFAPFMHNGEKVIEHRIITLNNGTYFNKVAVTYEGLTKPDTSVVGIVLHDRKVENVAFDENLHVCTYEDPTEKYSLNNRIFVGVITPTQKVKHSILFFSEKERINKRGRAAYGHALSTMIYNPEKSTVYYYGGAWNKADIKSKQEWDAYVKTVAEKIENPLILEY